MDLDEIKALIALMAESGLAEMSVSENGWSLRLVRDGGPLYPVRDGGPLYPVRDGGPLPQPRPAAKPSPAAAPLAGPAMLAAPLSGILHLQPAPGAAPYVREGQAVRAGDTLCVIEAMKVFNAVTAEQDGVIAAVLAAGGAEVEAGQTLMRFA